MKNKFTLFLLLCCFITTVSSYSQTTKMTFTSVKGAGAQKNWEADTCWAQLVKDVNKNTSITITGRFPTGNSSYPYQLLVMEIKNYTGPNTYNLNTNNSYFQDLFGSGGLKRSPCLSGSITIVAYNKATNKISGNFDLRVQSTPNVGDPYVTQIINGVAVAHVENKLFQTIKPSAIDTLKAKPKENVTFVVTVKDKDEEVVEGASIALTTNLLGVTDSVINGTTDANGNISCTIKVPAKAIKGNYQLIFKAKKDSYETSDTVKRILAVDTSQRHYYYRCGGLPLWDFDAGENNIWDDAKNGRITTKSNTVRINDFIVFDGDITIDTVPGRERISGVGKFYIPNVTLPGTGSTGDFVIYERGPYTIGLACFGAKCLDTLVNQAGTKLLGLNFKLDTFKIVGDKGNLGVQIAATLRWESKLQGNCADTTGVIKDTASVAVNFTVRTSGIENFSLAFKDVTIGPQQCVQEISVYYNSPLDTANFKGRYKNIAMTIGANLAFKNGGFNGLGIEYSPGTKVPLGQTDLCMKTISGGIRGFSAKPFILDISSVIVPCQDALGNLLELTASGQYMHPGIFTLTGKATLLKIEAINKLKPWQVEGSLSGKMDLYNGITYTGSMKMGHLGGTFYFFDGSASVGIQTSPAISLFSSVKGTMNVPDLGDEVRKGWLGKILSKFITVFPSQLGFAEGMLKVGFTEKKFTSNVDFSQSPVEQLRSLGKGYCIIDFDKAGSVGFVDIGEGYIPLKGIAPDTKGNQVQELVKGATIKANPLDSFNIDNSIERAFVLVSSQTKIPATTLISPDGTKYTATASDSSVIYSISPDNQLGFWSLINPKVGVWHIQLVNPAATDSIEVEAKRKNNPLTISATVNNRVLKVQWDGSKESDDTNYDVFLDTDNKDYNGYWVGNVPAKNGVFTTLLSDSLSECTYNVFVAKSGSSTFDRSYAPNVISTGKTILAPPQSFTTYAYSFNKNQIFLSWSKSPDPAVAGYSIYVRDNNGNDSLYASLYKNELSTEINVDDIQNKQIWIQSFNAIGLKGCPSVPQSVTVGVDEEKGAWLSTENPIVVIPNPASTQATIHFTLQHDAQTRVVLVNTLGQIVTELTNSVLQQGMHSVQCSTALISDGMYFVRVITPQEQFSTPMTVVR